MKSIRSAICATILVSVLLLVGGTTSVSGVGRGTHGIAATVHPIATDAAVAAMREGGNAIDAAVAAALTLGVVDGHNSGISGGCFLLIRLANGSVVAIDGRETAPAKAHRDMFVHDGKADLQLSQTGALASGVPGALAAYDLAIRRYGKLSLGNHLRNAADIAERGFKLDRTYAQRLAATADELRQFDAARKIFLKSDGSAYRAGELLKQPELATTYRAIADRGIDWFYRGPFALRTEQWMKENQGLLSAFDFSNYTARIREPITNTYRGYTIIGFPPPSSGGIHVAQILNIVEAFDLKKMGPSSADFVHVVSEAMKLAFADRAFWLGDPDFVAVPRGLISKDYAARLVRRIRMDKMSPVEAHDTPDRSADEIFGKHTTHFCTADEAGNWVACTATINTSFGSKIVIQGTGVLLNNQMDDFAIQPGVANYFGLIGAEANAVAPGKRPLSSMSPTIVLKDGKPILSVGAAGGPTIISQAVLAIIYAIDFNLPVEKALAAPRFHHQWRPDHLRIEKSFGESVLSELRHRGHSVVPVESLGACQGMGFDPETKAFTGRADPRGEGKASGW